MNLAQIKQAIAEGKKVYWRNEHYRVVPNWGQYLIVYDYRGKHENAIGLTWADGVTLNGAEEDFFI